MADNTKKKENNKVKKSFFKDVKAELKKVTWPTTKQVVNNTVGVIIIVIITAIIVFVLDFTFKNFNEYVVNGVRTEISQMTDDDTVLEDNLLENAVVNDSTTENLLIENNVSE